jgi:hypothetical protein
MSAEYGKSRTAFPELHCGAAALTADNYEEAKVALTALAAETTGD